MRQSEHGEEVFVSCSTTNSADDQYTLMLGPKSNLTLILTLLTLTRR